jgi:hypothetical protein
VGDLELMTYFSGLPFWQYGVLAPLLLQQLSVGLYALQDQHHLLQLATVRETKYYIMDDNSTNILPK